jgi:hypothetical protein
MTTVDVPSVHEKDAFARVTAMLDKFQESRQMRWLLDIAFVKWTQAHAVERHLGRALAAEFACQKLTSRLLFRGQEIAQFFARRSHYRSLQISIVAAWRQHSVGRRNHVAEIERKLNHDLLHALLSTMFQAWLQNSVRQDILVEHGTQHFGGELFWKEATARMNRVSPKFEESTVSRRSRSADHEAWSNELIMKCVASFFNAWRGERTVRSVYVPDLHWEAHEDFVEHAFANVKWTRDVRAPGPSCQKLDTYLANIQCTMMFTMVFRAWLHSVTSSKQQHVASQLEGLQAVNMRASSMALKTLEALQAHQYFVAWRETLKSLRSACRSADVQSSCAKRSSVTRILIAWQQVCKTQSFELLRQRTSRAQGSKTAGLRLRWFHTLMSAVTSASRKSMLFSGFTFALARGSSKRHLVFLFSTWQQWCAVAKHARDVEETLLQMRTQDQNATSMQMRFYRSQMAENLAQQCSQGLKFQVFASWTYLSRASPVNPQALGMQKRGMGVVRCLFHDWHSYSRRTFRMHQQSLGHRNHWMLHVSIRRWYRCSWRPAAVKHKVCKYHAHWHHDFDLAENLPSVHFLSLRVLVGWFMHSCDMLRKKATDSQSLELAWASKSVLMMLNAFSRWARRTSEAMYRRCCKELQRAGSNIRQTVSLAFELHLHFCLSTAFIGWLRHLFDACLSHSLQNVDMVIAAYKNQASKRAGKSLYTLARDMIVLWRCLAFKQLPGIALGAHNFGA